MPQVHFARKTITLLMVLVLLSGFMVPGRVTAAGPTVFINEIHYDNNSTDVGEAVEIAGPAGTDLAGWSLVLYNGNGGAPYNTISLSGTIPDLGNGFGVVAVPTVGIQNGSPDGLALVNGSTVVQFLSYEGTFTAVGGPANGMLSVDIGVSEASNSTTGDSLQLVGTGVGYDDFTWAASQPNTFGAFNTGQSFQGTSGPAEPTLNEFVFNHTGIDNYEFVEVYGTPNTDYSAYTLLQVEGDGAGAGVIDSIQTVGTTNAEGFWVTPFLSNVYENGTLTLLMVSGFTGSQGSDLDTDNDGIFDTTPWTVEADGS